MKITLNGSPYPVAEGTSVTDLIVSVTGAERGSAVVIDGEVVPRSAWPATALHDGQSVELITAVQGG